MWHNSIEAAFIIIAACIPSLRPFVKALGRSLHLDQAKSLLIPKGYHHSHSRRHRPPPLVPRDSGSGATAGTATRNRSGPDEDVESGTAMQQEKRQEFAEATTPSTAKTDKSMEKEAEEAMSHV